VERNGRRDELLVRIPPGITNGTRLRLSGKGEGEPPGDAYLEVRIADE
jgi:molecular chaperone DnaJ